MKLQPKDKLSLLKAALGEIPADLLIQNANLVNVLTGEIYPANVFVYDGFIAHVEYENMEDLGAGAAEVIDADGKYLIPGLIDAHMHIESSMMTPRNFAQAAIPQGTTTVVTDPHEIANVWGLDGVRYMHAASADLPMRQLIDIPSCVPSVPGLENAGAEFLVPEIEEIASLDRVLGLAEVMDFLGVIHGDKRMMDIIRAAEDRGLYIQGHSPFVTGRNLSAYLCGGPTTCHETVFAHDALQKLRSGMFVDARSSSISKNVTAIWDGVKDIRFFDNLCLCTDDRESDEILGDGHINDVIREIVAHGMDPVLAIKSATYNTAREIHVDNLGAVAPGFAADMLLVDDLSYPRPSHVFYGGRLVAKDGRMVAKVEKKVFDLERQNSMHVKPLTEDDFKIKPPVQNGEVTMNIMGYATMNQAGTRPEVVTLPVVDGEIKLNDPTLKFVAVVNRHKGHDTVGLSVVRNFGTNGGALASTVSHDSHNLTIVYQTAADALVAANRLIQCGGGMCAVRNRQILHTLELPLAGLMSLKEAPELAEDSRKMKEAMESMGLVGLKNPLLRIVTLALPVIPQVKMSDLGLIDVLNKKVIPTFAEQ